MYNLKPILTDQNIELPTSMYKMTPINPRGVDNTQVSKNNSVSDAFYENVDFFTEFF